VWHLELLFLILVLLTRGHILASEEQELRLGFTLMEVSKGQTKH